MRPGDAADIVARPKDMFFFWGGGWDKQDQKETIAILGVPYPNFATTPALIAQERYMTLLKILDAKTKQPMGVLNWFSVHATSMKSFSGLISGPAFTFPQTNMEAPTPLEDLVPFTDAFWELPC